MDYEVMMNGKVNVGQMAPDFETIGTMGEVSLSKYRGKWLVFFSYPEDFTPVSTTELIEFSKAYKYFENINTNLLAISTDSNNSHISWLYDIYIHTGIKVPFPIVADKSEELARKYGMITSDVSKICALRNVYIIDPNGIIRAIFVYPLNVGRFVPEILRIVSAMQMSEEEKVRIPANWVPKRETISEPPKTINTLYEGDLNSNSWYLKLR